MDRVNKQFKITTEDGTIVNATLEMYDSGAFQYGNGHTITLKETWDNGKTERSFDARYDHRFDNVDSFNEYAFQFVKEQVRDTCFVEEVKEENIE